MKISEAQAKKTKLENDIAALVREFEKETALAVWSIELIKEYDMIQNKTFATKVQVEL
jgi:hypothetical protein